MCHKVPTGVGATKQGCLGGTARLGSLRQGKEHPKQRAFVWVERAPQSQPFLALWQHWRAAGQAMDAKHYIVTLL